MTWRAFACLFDITAIVALCVVCTVHRAPELADLLSLAGLGFMLGIDVCRLIWLVRLRAETRHVR